MVISALCPYVPEPPSSCMILIFFAFISVNKRREILELKKCWELKSMAGPCGSAGRETGSREQHRQHRKHRGRIVWGRETERELRSSALRLIENEAQARECQMTSALPAVDMQAVQAQDALLSPLPLRVRQVERPQRSPINVCCQIQSPEFWTRLCFPPS